MYPEKKLHQVTVSAMITCCPVFDLSSTYYPRSQETLTHWRCHKAACALSAEPLPSAQLSPKYPPSNTLRSHFTLMSHTQSPAASSSNFHVLITSALDTYRKRTKKDLLSHPLAARLQACDTPSAILTILREQIQGLDQSQNSAERWSKWLDPTVNVLFAFSATIGAGVGLVCLMTCTHSRSAFSYSFGRYFLPRM